MFQAYNYLHLKQLFKKNLFYINQNSYENFTPSFDFFTFEYVNEGHNIYFLTDRKSTKVKHIHANSNIAFTVDEDLSDWSKIQGIQMRGEAVIVTDEKEGNRVMDMLLSKFPQFNEMPSEGVDVCIVKIIPITGIFIDNPSGFGNRYEVHYR